MLFSFSSVTYTLAECVLTSEIPPHVSISHDTRGDNAYSVKEPAEFKVKRYVCYIPIADDELSLKCSTFDGRSGRRLNNSQAVFSLWGPALKLCLVRVLAAVCWLQEGPG